MADDTENGAPSATQAAAAAAAISVAEAQITTPTLPGAPILNPAVLDRLGVQRRVLGFITDEVDKTALGPRNTLHALTYGLMRDRNTTNPPETHGRLEVQGKSVQEIAQQVLDLVNELIEHGLVAEREDGSYELTDAGHSELAS